MPPKKAAAKAAPASRRVQMVVPDAQPDYDEDEFDVSAAPEDWEWETVAEESAIRVVFDTPGDTFIGEYLQVRTITPDNGDLKPTSPNWQEPFDLYLFRARDGKVYSLNKSWKLEEAMDGIESGTWCRIVYVKDVPTKKGLNAMKDLRVDVRTN